MNGSGLLERVRGWFGNGGRAGPEARSRADARFWSSVHQSASAALLFASSGGAGAAALRGPVPQGPRPSHESPALKLAPPPCAPEGPRPRDPEAAAWREAPERELVELLRGLPDRIARSVNRPAPGGESIGQMAEELRDHRQTHRSIAEAVGQLPEQATTQTDLLRKGNQLAERHARVTESVLDELTALRTAFRNVDESSRRNLRCLAQIEANHREVLREYQDLLVVQHRRLWRAAILATVLAAFSLAGVAYVLSVAHRV